MKILITCNSASGLERFRGRLIKELISKGDKIFAIVPLTIDDKEIQAERELKKLSCNLIHVKMERRGINPFVDIKLILDYRRILNKEKPNYVITYTIKPNIYMGWLCKRKAIAYAINITGLGSAFQKNNYIKKLVIFMYKRAVKNANVVFFENSENKDVMLHYKIVRKEQICVLNGAGVDLQEFSLKKYPTDGEKIKFLFIGRVMREKGIDELFSAMQYLIRDGVNCSLDILGGFEEDYKHKIEQYEKEGWLYYRGYQDNVQEYIEKCHCFVLPSWHEGMANTNLECAACGRPIITSDIAGCREAVIEGKSGFLVKKQDPLELYKVMKKFCELSYFEKEKLGINGRKHMEKCFDKIKVVDKTITKIFDSFINAQ